MKRIVWSCVGLVLGVLSIVGATFALFDDTVTCGGEEMRPGQTCVREKNGTVVSTSDLDEAKTDGQIGKIMGIVFGVAIVAISAHNLRIGLRQRKTAANPAAFAQPGLPAPAPGTWNQPPGAPQGWQQPQYQPMQQPQSPHYPQPPHQGWQQHPPHQQPYPQTPQHGWHQHPPHSNPPQHG